MGFVDFFKKTWKFLLGIFITILGVFLISRKERTGEVIGKSTEAGLKSIDDIRDSNSEAKEKLLEAEKSHSLKLDKIRDDFSKQEKEIKSSARKKIKKALESGDVKEATNLLSEATGIKNLDQ